MIINNDCWEHIKTLEENSIDHIITDPPYDIGFMNKGWDKNSIVSNPEFWKECLRVLKPGGYILAFSHSRTSHRQTAAIEDAGFEIRDTVMWLYGQGFPKSHNVSLGIDKKNGHGNRGRAIPTASSYQASDKEQKNKLTANKVDEYIAKSDAAKEWLGWGTALKPAYEPVVMARKPFEGTVADNVLKWGTGAINIDACRIGTEKVITNGKGNKFVDNLPHGERTGENVPGVNIEHIGRFPANVIFDEEAGKILDKQVDASRFFYCPKVSTKERGQNNNHPTVKPIKLMEYLIKLVSREGQTILDPFAGSGSTGLACKNLNRKYILIEKSSEYYEIIKARLGE